MNKFFVYGTLMTDCSNHKIIPQDSIENIERATIDNVELYSYINGKFPCLIEGKSKVFGELITIKKSHLSNVKKLMDRLEGYNEKAPESYNLYNRKIKEVKLEDGSIINAYVYMFNPERNGLGSLITEGDWKIWTRRINK